MDFSIESLYNRYLKMVKLDETTMSPLQIVETKRAFMGGAAIMLVTVRDGISDLDDNQALQVLESLDDQLNSFWKDQQK